MPFEEFVETQLQHRPTQEVAAVIAEDGKWQLRLIALPKAMARSQLKFLG